MLSAPSAARSLQNGNSFLAIATRLYSVAAIIPSTQYFDDKFPLFITDAKKAATFG